MIYHKNVNVIKRQKYKFRFLDAFLWICPYHNFCEIAFCVIKVDGVILAILTLEKKLAISYTKKIKFRSILIFDEDEIPQKS